MKTIRGFLFGLVFAGVCLALLSSLFGKSMHSGCHKCNVANYELSSINDALTVYGLDNKDFPAKEMFTSAILETDFLSAVPKDPWGNDYQYTTYTTSKYTCFMVWSFGSDGKPGGKEDHQHDIYKTPTENNCVENLKT